MTYRIAFDSIGVRIVDASESSVARIHWDEVQAVSAYKVDAKTKEIAFLTFDFTWGEFLEVTDEMDGFAALVGRLHEFLELTAADERQRLVALKPGDRSIILFEKRAE